MKTLITHCDICGKINASTYAFGQRKCDMYELCDQCIFFIYKFAFEVFVEKYFKNPDQTKNEILNTIITELMNHAPS